MTTNLFCWSDLESDFEYPFPNDYASFHVKRGKFTKFSFNCLTFDYYSYRKIISFDLMLILIAGIGRKSKNDCILWFTISF